MNANKLVISFSFYHWDQNQGSQESFKMSKAERDLRVFLSPDSDLPPDVFFLVQGIEEETGSSNSKTFGAHRFVLAAVSPVFRRMFFGPMKEMVEVIEVKETTPEAFDCMIKFIYEPQGGDIRVVQKFKKLSETPATPPMIAKLCMNDCKNREIAEKLV